jgi:hypothetical protein
MAVETLTHIREAQELVSQITTLINNVVAENAELRMTVAARDQMIEDCHRGLQGHIAEINTLRALNTASADKNDALARENAMLREALQAIWTRLRNTNRFTDRTRLCEEISDMVEHALNAEPTQ